MSIPCNGATKKVCAQVKSLMIDFKISNYCVQVYFWRSSGIDRKPLSNTCKYEIMTISIIKQDNKLFPMNGTLNLKQTMWRNKEMRATFFIVFGMIILVRIVIFTQAGITLCSSSISCTILSWQSLSLAY